MHEVWQYETTIYDPTLKTGGLFAEYINKYLKIKQEASGWPAECLTEEQKLEYIANYELNEGIKLEYNKIEYNPGLRFIAKLALNTIWGKYCQRNNLKQHVIFDNTQQMYKKIAEPGIIINCFRAVDVDKLIMMYEYEKEAAQPLNFVNVAVAAYTTAQARMRLYDVMEKLGGNLLYVDTDAALFVAPDGVDYNLPIGNYLGQLTSETSDYGADSYITMFVSGGPKNYAYSVFSPTTNKTTHIMKVKGITMNSGNSHIVNIETLKDMVLHSREEVVVEYPYKIRRTNYHELITTPQSKRYRVVYTKRRIVNSTYDTLPYGYVD
jgi:hypothetical protein